MWPALRILGECRTAFGLQIRLCWNSDDVHLVEVIDVYPTATLSARGMRSSGYKKRSSRSHGKRLQQPWTCVERAEKESQVLELAL